jgi:hypothetical protein
MRKEQHVHLENASLEESAKKLIVFHNLILKPQLGCPTWDTLWEQTRENLNAQSMCKYLYIYMDVQYDAKYVISYIQLMHNDMQISLYICACVHVLC